MSLRILLVDDHLAIRNSLRSFIEANTKWSVCGEAENGQVALDKVLVLHPDLVILDFSMPVMNGLEAAEKIAAVAPQVVTVLFTLHISEQLRREAEAVGVRQVFSKAEGISGKLIAAIETACAGC